jgi:hypothetical protein
LRFISLIVLLLFLPLVSGLGVAPGSIELEEGSSSFIFKVFNNEGLDLDVFFEVQGDDFIELDVSNFSFSSGVPDKIFNAKIKSGDYDFSQRANIVIYEARSGGSQINVNLGLFLPVTLLVYEENALLDASLSVPLRSAFAKGPYVVSLRNLGLRDASGIIKLVVNDKEVSKSFFVKGRGRESVILDFDDVFSKGSYDVSVFIEYDNSLNLSSVVFSGSPFINVSRLNVIDLSNSILSLELFMNSDWPSSLYDLSVVAIVSGSEFESRSFSLNEFGSVSIPLFVEVVEDEFVLYVSINNQDFQEFNILIKDNVVFVNGEPFILRSSSPFNLLLVVIILLIVSSFIIFELGFFKKKRKKK